MAGDMDLRSSSSAPDLAESVDVGCVFVQGTVCAIAADSDGDMIRFIKVVKDEDVAETTLQDDYQKHVAAGQKYMEGRLLEKAGSNRSGHKFKVSSKRSFFFRDSVLYPYVEFDDAGRFMILSIKEYYNVLHYTGLHSG